MTNPLPIDVTSNSTRSELTDWSSLANMGKQLTQVGLQMTQLANRHSMPQRHDLAQMMELSSQLAHVGSTFLRQSYPATTPAAATAPGRRETPVQEQANANKRTRFAMPYQEPYPPTATTFSAPFQITAPLPRTDVIPTETTPPDVTPSSSDDTLDEHTHSLLQYFSPEGVDEDLLNDFVDHFGGNAAKNTVGSSSSDVDNQDGTRDEINHVPASDQRQVNKQGNSKDGKYLKKLVAITNPKMTLETYFERANGNLICLCGRGGHNSNHQGNRNFYEFIDTHLQTYRSLSKKDKEALTNSLVQEYKKQGRRIFKLNEDTDEWEEADTASARNKISQRFRDA